MTWQPVRCWWCGQTVGSNAGCHGCRSFNWRVVLPRMSATMTAEEFGAAVMASPGLYAALREWERRAGYRERDEH